MTTHEIRIAEDTCLIPTYRKLPIALVRGDGNYVWDAEGRRYLDFYGGHCVCLLGHCHPRITAAIQRQSNQLLFYSNVAYSDVRARAGQLLADLAPLKHIFFCNSGTEAIETALKIARKKTGRSMVIGMEGGFHGRTLGSLAMTWNPAYRKPYRDVLAPTVFVPFGDLEALETTLDQHKESVAAVILEPIQSIAGMVQAPDAYYQELRMLCDQHDTLLIFDEVQTGVGRTGTFSISEQFHIIPDIITLAKSLGAGMPVGAALISDPLATNIQYGDQGSTFGGGMLAMAAVEACLQTIRDDNLMARTTPIFNQIKDAVQSTVSEVRGRGCLIGIKFHGPAAPIITELRSHGILTGGSADPNVMRLMPPLTTSDSDIDYFTTTITDILATG